MTRALFPSAGTEWGHALRSVQFFVPPCAMSSRERLCWCWRSLRASLWVAAATALYGPGTPAQAEWAAIAEQKTSYTTDAFQFSSARRLRFSEDPSQPTVVSIDKPQDVIWEPRSNSSRQRTPRWEAMSYRSRRRAQFIRTTPSLTMAIIVSRID